MKKRRQAIPLRTGISGRSVEMALQLTVRFLTGAICGAAGAFVASLMNAALIPAGDADDIVAGAVRIVVIGLAAALTSQIGWIGVSETRRRSALIWIASSVVAALGVWVALIAASAVLQNPDLYRLNRDISGFGLFGGALASNFIPLAVAFRLALKGEI